MEALERGLALSAVLGDREELGNGERKAMRELGLRYRGRGRWPVFRSVIPGHWPWYLGGDEARFLTVALDNVRDVAERIGRGHAGSLRRPGPRGGADPDAAGRRVAGRSGNRCGRRRCPPRSTGRTRTGCNRSAGRRPWAQRCGR